MIHSFLLIGQSNMAGRGFLNEAPEIDTSRIFTLRNGRWQPMFRPINPDRSFSGTSLAESFAEAYAKKYDVDVGLICCADGGTKLNQWEKGSILFENAVNQAKLAKRTSVIKGILWHQGESDCPLEWRTTYADCLKVFIKDLREATELYDVPFIAGGLGDFLALYDDSKMKYNDTMKNYFYINEALQSVVDSDETLGFVSAKGLGANPDNLHFNAKSLYEFGLRYFDEFEKFEKKDSLEVELENDSKRSEIEAL